MFIPDCSKNQNLCDNTVDNYVYALGYIHNSYKTQ